MIILDLLAALWLSYRSRKLGGPSIKVWTRKHRTEIIIRKVS